MRNGRYRKEKDDCSHCPHRGFTEELQDAADIIRDIMPNITIRDNQEVNVYLNICHIGGDHEQTDT